MFLVRRIRKLFSLPFLWAGQLASAFKLPLSVPLLTAAWYVSGDGNVARSALFAMHRCGHSDAAVAQADTWLVRRPRPEIAAFAALMAYQAGEFDAAESYLAHGRRLGDDRDGLLDLLAYTISKHGADSDATGELARRLENRSDLPPDLSRMVLTDLMWAAMTDEQFDNARRRARHLLEVDDEPQAEIALWALAKRDADAPGARKHLARARIKPADKVYWQFFGLVAIGWMQEARDMLEQLKGLDASYAAQAEALGRWKESR